MLNRSSLCLSLVALTLVTASSHAEFKLNKGDHVAYIGNNTADRMQHHAWLETYIHAMHPTHNLYVRNLGFTGDEVNKRPRSSNFGSPDQWLTKVKADVVFCFFGYNEALQGEGAANGFRGNLEKMIDQMRGQKYNGKSAPRLVVFSPIAHENLNSPHLPDGSANNILLELYTNVMREVCTAKKVTFVDLFEPSKALYAKHKDQLTMNGIHLLDSGNKLIAQVIMKQLFGDVVRRTVSDAQLTKLNEAIRDKNLHWFSRYRVVDGYNVYGGRSKLNWHNQSNADVMAVEMAGFDVMTENRDKRVWAIANGGDLKVIDNNLPKQLVVQSNRKGKNQDGTFPYISGEEGISKMKIAEGMKVNLFATEERFPRLINPVQIAVDTDSRLWASVWPSYPHWNPNNTPKDALVILPDENGDGVADKLIVFADKLNSITGFEFWGGGVLVFAPPEIWFLKDTDGDDKADYKLRILQGISSADTHHSANAVVLGPDGWLYWSRGIFNIANIETPTKTYRSGGSGVHRFNPLTYEIEFHFPIGPNPHGDVIDQWGFQFANDGTGGTGSYVNIGKGKGNKKWFQKRVRPVPATGILSSSHFPDRNSGNFLICNAIGFLGVLQHEVQYNGADITATEIEPILVSSDPNFRPTDVEVGGDGALYVSDWSNALIGHMQHNMRDPNRDHTHGRIYRVTSTAPDAGPLLKPAKMKGKPIEQVCENFFERTNSVRYRARLELTGRDRNEIIQKVNSFAGRLSPGKVTKERDEAQALLECLWVFELHRAPNLSLLKKVFLAKEPRVRAAAIRTLGHWAQLGVTGWEATLVAAARDTSALVRAEAVKAAVEFEGLAAGEVIFEVATRKMDPELETVLSYGRSQIEVDSMISDALKSGKQLSPAAQAYALQNASADSLLKMKRSDAVYTALLTRGGIPAQYRMEAVDAFAKKNNHKPSVELIARIIEAEKSERVSLGDLTKILSGMNKDELYGAGSAIVELATNSKLSQVRSAAYGAWITVSHAPTAWEHASKSKTTLSDLLNALSLVKDKQKLAAMYPLIRPLMFKLPKHLASSNLSTVDTSSLAPGVSFAYYEPHLRDAKLETHNKAKPKFTGKMKDFNKYVPKGRHDQFSIKQTASIYIPRDGKWTFFTNSDDGSRLYIDGKSVVNNDGNHGDVEKNGTVNLSEGLHEIIVNYFDSGGGDGLTVSWQGPGQKKQRIPAKALSSSGSGGGLQNAAIRAIGHLPSNDGDRFRDLARVLTSGKNRNAAISSLSRIKESSWPRAEAQSLAREFAPVAAEVPLSMRSGQSYKNLVALGHKLSALLPKAEGDKLRNELSSQSLQVIRIEAIPEKMLYNKTSFAVVAGKPVRIVFHNPDAQPHNIIITQPGGAAKVGPLAEKMGPEGFRKQFKPDHDSIMWATKMINQGETVTLNFMAPKVGTYDFLCTFPGHWQLMNGKMRVVATAADLPADAAGAGQRLIKDWKVQDLASDLLAMKSGRNYKNASRVWTKLGCLQCHKLKGIKEGGAVGPELTETFKKWKNNRVDVLTQILEPSKVVEDKYKAFTIETLEGKLFGLVTESTKTHITIITNPQNPVPLKLARDDVDSIKVTKQSLMPGGLLSLLNKDDILDVMALIESAGDSKHTLFKK